MKLSILSHQTLLVKKIFLTKNALRSNVGPCDLCDHRIFVFLKNLHQLSGYTVGRIRTCPVALLESSHHSLILFVRQQLLQFFLWWQKSFEFFNIGFVSSNTHWFEIIL